MWTASRAMNPVEIGIGKSFKGLAAYLLHDPERAATAARVAWAQSFNLDDADPDRAWRLMAATAMSADQLKAAAGVKKGKKALNTAYHFSLNFNPADHPTEATQRAAVESALKAMGLESYQALAVGHRDTEHQHVHVMVNLINPENGLSAASKQPDGSPALLSNSQKKLSRWAQEFEREHRLAVTEGRLENANKRAQGELVDARRKPRNVYDRDKSETTDRRRDFLKQKFTAGERDLSSESRQMHERHGDDWTAAKHSYKAHKDAIWDAHKKRSAERIENTKAQTKKRWSAMFMRQRDELRDFERGERSVVGRIWHAAATFKELAQDGNALGGFLAAFSQDARRAIVMRKHEREAKTLDKQVRASFSAEYAKLNEELKGAQVQARHRFLMQCDELKKEQAEARDAMKERWREHNAARRVALNVLQARQPQQDRAREWQLERGRGLEPD